MDTGGSTDMTLAFELAALKSLSDPNAVFNDARGWTEYVGVVSEKPTYVVTNFTRKHRIRQDFFSGPRGVTESLENIQAQFDTGRHVFVGSGEQDSAVADELTGNFSPSRMPPRRPTGRLARTTTPSLTPSRATTATTGPEAATVTLAGEATTRKRRSAMLV
jgi:hypothetical protein